VRIIVLALLVAFVTSSCDLESTSTSILSLALPSSTTAALAATSMASNRSLIDQTCTFSLGTEPDAATQAGLLRSLAGIWRDSLGTSIENDQKIRSQEGLRFGPGEQPGLAQLEVGRAVVSIVPSEVSNDDFETQGFELVAKSSNVQVGQTSSDGFTALQARFQGPTRSSRCIMYAFKVNQMADGRQILLVRGPLEAKISESPKSISSFFYLVHDTTKMFTR